MIQWLRIYLPMQGTQVQSLVQEDPACQGPPSQYEAHTLASKQESCCRFYRFKKSDRNAYF